MSDLIDIEVVFATPSKQVLIAVRVPRKSTVAEAIAASGITRKFPGAAIDELEVGIWGRIVKRSREIRDGDRVEIYRPLLIEPREARRQLAIAGKTMGTPPGEKQGGH